MMRTTRTERIRVAVDGEVKQDTDLSGLIRSVPEIIAFASRSMAPAPVDLIYTGTRAGGGPVRRGEVVTGDIEGVGEIRITVC